jgi:hypothetical protein
MSYRIAPGASARPNEYPFQSLVTNNQPDVMNGSLDVFITMFPVANVWANWPKPADIQPKFVDPHHFPS